MPISIALNLLSWDDGGGLIHFSINREFLYHDDLDWTKVSSDL